MKFCWTKACDLNTAIGMRQSAIGYLVSILARSKYIKVDMVKRYLQTLCDWIHQYIQRCDTNQSSHPLRTHTVFYSICQAVFYIISFRSRELTCTNKSNISFFFYFKTQFLILTSFRRFALPANVTIKHNCHE